MNHSVELLRRSLERPDTLSEPTVTLSKPSEPLIPPTEPLCLSAKLFDRWQEQLSKLSEWSI